MVRSIMLAASIATASALGGCSNDLMLTQAPDETQGPTVRDLEQHITCEVYEVMTRPSTPDDKKPEPTKTVGDRLREYNFVGSATITLGITDTGGFNPSLSFINPYHTSTGLSSTLNKTFSLGGQVNGTRDRSFSFVYNIDLNTFAKDAPTICQDIKDQKTGAIITGNLDMARVLADGIASIDTTQNNNYTSVPETCGDPMAQYRMADDINALNTSFARLLKDEKKLTESGDPNSADIAQAQKDIKDNQDLSDSVNGRVKTSTDTDLCHFAVNFAATELLQNDKLVVATINKELQSPHHGQAHREFAERNVLMLLGGGGPSTGVGAPKSASAPAPATYFSSTIDFSLTYGLNGGATWNLTHFKGPGGGTTSLLTGSRAYADTFQVSFAPTCRNADVIPALLPPPKNFWQTLPECQGIPGGAASFKNATSFQLQLNNTLNALPQEVRRSLQQE